MIELGRKYKDKITGFEGVAIGHVKYLTGCNQTLLSPETDDVRKKPEAEWLDDQRLEMLAYYPQLALDNGGQPGCDRAAPKR